MTFHYPQLYWYEQRLANVPEENSWLTAAERQQLNRFTIPKRRSDWRLGRWTAKWAASAYLGWPANRFHEIEVVSDSWGAPTLVFSDGSVAPEISISHSHAVCACLVGPPGVWIGCDIERVEMRSQVFLHTFFTDEETALVAACFGRAAEIFATLIWSAKESYLKATRAGLRRDTKDFEIRLSKSARSEMSSAIPSDWFPLWILDYGTCVLGTCRLAGGFVQTAVRNTGTHAEEWSELAHNLVTA